MNAGSLRRFLLLSVLLIPFSCIGGKLCAQDFSAVEITSEKEDTGKVLYTFRFTPCKSQNFSQLIFTCQYHQEFPFEDSSGKKYNKIHEPDVFTYKYTGSDAKDGKFVDELDKEINFRVQLKMDELKKVFGDKMFNEKYPVTISMITLKGISEEKKEIFCYKFKPQGKYVWNSEKNKFELGK